MFPKKIVSALFDILALLLLLKVLLSLIMFFWSFSGTPPLPLLSPDVVANSPQGYLLILHEVGGNIFAYLVLVMVAKLAGVSKIK